MSSDYTKTYSLLEPLANKLRFEGGVISGTLTADKELLNNLSDLGSDNTIQLDVKRSCLPNFLNEIDIGESFEIRIEPTRTNGHFFGLNLADLLSSQGGKYCQEIPSKSLCLVADSWRGWEPESSKYRQTVSINAYYKLIDFISFLASDVANHSKDQNLHFFGNDENLVVPIRYDASAVEENSKIILDSISQIEIIVGSEAYKSDKCKQLKYVLIDHLKNAPKKDRFNKLIEGLSDVAHRFHHNYELFVSGFSFEDSKEKLKTENREYTDKINSVIDSIHSRILGIPIGTVVPALLIKSEKFEGMGLEWLIFFASFFLVLVIAVSLRNQYILLNKIKSEYSEKWKRMKSDLPNSVDELKSEYDDLDKSYGRNVALIYIFSASLFCFFLAPVSIYLGPKLKAAIQSLCL